MFSARKIVFPSQTVFSRGVPEYVVFGVPKQQFQQKTHLENMFGKQKVVATFVARSDLYHRPPTAPCGASFMTRLVS